MNRTYSELIQIPTYKERYLYLKLNGQVGEETFGFDRYINQKFYTSNEWKRLRREIILRDKGRDMAFEGYEIQRGIIIHHMNPITVRDIIDLNEFAMNPEYLVCVSLGTHNAIHYGDESQLNLGPVIRRPNDTCPWKR